MSETIYGRLGGAAKRTAAQPEIADSLTPPSQEGVGQLGAVAAAPTPETDAYPTGSIEALIHASRNHNGMSVGMPKIHVDSGWVEHILIRSRKLERERDELKTAWKQALTNIANGVRRAEAAENRLREIEEVQLPDYSNRFCSISEYVEAIRTHDLHLEAENLKLLEDAERYRFLRGVDAHGIQVYDCINDPHESIIGTELDRAIDAARKAKEAK